jgi:hypothetical protein
MSKTKTRPGFSKLKITWLLLALAGVFAVGSYGWHVYTLFRDWQVNMPQPQIEKLTKDLRIYHAKTGHFPSSFVEINNLIWHTKPAPDYGDNGRQSRTKNYYYFYTRVNDHTCALWALPTGPQRHYASSFFLVLSPDWLRGWRGKALDDETIGVLPAIPLLGKLSELGMQEVLGQVFAGQK